MGKIVALIVEDEAIVAMDIAGCLEAVGYSVAGTVATGHAAITLVKEHDIDIVLMDIQLKGEMDGVETARQIRLLKPIPLIYLTAQTDLATVERAKTTFPSAYLAKPFDEKNLHLAIEMALHNFAFQKTASLPVQAANPSEKAVLTADNILRTDSAIFIKQNYKFVKFVPDDLLFCQADGVYTDLITKSKKYSLRLGLQVVIEKLHYQHLVRIHRSYAVNRLNIESFTDQTVWVAGQELPIGGAYRDDFIGGFEFS